MGLGLFALAGALQGAGKGMTMQAENDVLDRRQAALEAARNASMEREYQLRDQNDATSKKRDTDSALTLQRDRAAGEAKIAEAGAGAKAAQAEADRKHERAMKILDGQITKDTRLAEIAAQRETDYGKPIDTYVADDGTVTAVYRGGKTETYGKVGPTAKAKEDSQPLVNRRGDGKLPRAVVDGGIWDPKTGTFKPAEER